MIVVNCNRSDQKSHRLFTRFSDSSYLSLGLRWRGHHYKMPMHHCKAPKCMYMYVAFYQWHSNAILDLPSGLSPV